MRDEASSMRDEASSTTHDETLAAHDDALSMRAEDIVGRQDSLETFFLVAQFRIFDHGEGRFFDRFCGGLVW
jgi:hypothetical protein